MRMQSTTKEMQMHPYRILLYSIVSVLSWSCGSPKNEYLGADSGFDAAVVNGSDGCNSMAKWMSLCGDEALDVDAVIDQCMAEVERIESLCDEEVALQYSVGLEVAYECFLNLGFCGTEEDVEMNPDAGDQCGQLFEDQIDMDQECLMVEDTESDTQFDSTVGLPPDEIEYEPAFTLRNQLNLTDDDFEVLELPYALSFFGEVYTALTITSNGLLLLGDVPYDGCCHGAEIPKVDEYNGLIALGWGDLVPNPDRPVSWQVVGEEPHRELWIHYDQIPAITNMDDHISTHMRWIEGEQYIDIFLDSIVYSEEMTVGVESGDGRWAVVLNEHNSQPIQTEKTAFRYSVEIPQ